MSLATRVRRVSLATRAQEAADCAAAAREKNEKFATASARAQAGLPVVPKQSQTTAARKKRKQREAAKKAKPPRKPDFDAADPDKKESKKAADVEKETHYTDERGRKRRLKKIRSIAAPSGTVGAGDARVFSPTEKELIIEQAKKMAKVQVGSKPDYAGVARELQRLHPTLFGRGAPGMQDGGIGRQVVRQIVTRAPKGEVSDARGRPPALPQACLLMIMAAFTSVVSVRATLVSAPMLQPIAIAIIISAGHGGLLHEGRKRRGVFVCSVNFIRELIKERGWKNVRPCGDTRKVPDNYVTLRWLMVLRLAYFVLVHSIPHELCLNGDHTGIRFTLAKGKMWITKAMHESKDKSVNNHGEKRQFTVLATTSAAGQMLPHQVVVAGKTAGSLPKFGKFKISLNGMNTNKVPKLAVCFVLTTLVQAVANIASFCTTYNHWSDNITSKAYVKDIVVPYFKAKIETMRAINPGRCKPFGEQICVLILDTWWGWYHIVPWVKQKYPWIRLIFVPAGCTPVAQPMDRGVIAKLKAIVRRMYNSWVIGLVTAQLKAGKPAGEVKVPAGDPTCKTNLFRWLSLAVDELNKDPAAIVHCWEETQLLRAWEGPVQAEAAGTDKKILFPKWHDYYPPTDLEEDLEAGFMGLPFTQPETEHEWEDQVNWDELERETVD